MPFDGANLILSTQVDLRSAMSACGLEAIDTRLLDRHKAEQIGRHPASWAYRRRRVLELGQAGVLGAGVVLFLALFSADQIACGAAAGLVALGLAVLLMLAPVKGPAQWRERIVFDLREHEAPAAIREAALRLQIRLPETRFVVGELFQDRITLDPYLLAEYGDARAVLGIWDGDQVIACA